MGAVANVVSTTRQQERGRCTYDWYYLVLEYVGDREEAEEEDAVELQGGEGQFGGGDGWEGRGRVTAVARRPREICCWARVILAGVGCKE